MLVGLHIYHHFLLFSQQKFRSAFLVFTLYMFVCVFVCAYPKTTPTLFDNLCISAHTIAGFLPSSCMMVAAWCSTFFIGTYTVSTTAAFPWGCVYFRKERFECFVHFFRKKECFKCFAHLFQSLQTMYCLKIFQLVLGLYSVYYDREEMLCVELQRNKK